MQSQKDFYQNPLNISSIPPKRLFLIIFIEALKSIILNSTTMKKLLLISAILLSATACNNQSTQEDISKQVEQK